MSTDILSRGPLVLRSVDLCLPDAHLLLTEKFLYLSIALAIDCCIVGHGVADV